MPEMTPTESFLQARDFLLRHREDYDVAYRDFRWPRLQRFNWALDVFDVIARNNPTPALWVVEENGPDASKKRLTPALWRWRNRSIQWLEAGATYAGYNVAAIPAVLFCLRPITRRREAITAGLLAGPIAMLPGVLFYVAMMSHYPQISEQPVPVDYLIGELHAPWFHALFQIVFFAVLVKSGTALLHAINERIARVYENGGNSMPRAMRAAIALVAMSIAVFAASRIGLVGLIAQGYGVLTYVFIVVLVVPVLTIGPWRICNPGATVRSGDSVR